MEFHSCTVCGCTTHWRPIDSSRRGGTLGVNARLLDPALLRAAEIQGPDTPAEQIHPANR